MFVNHDIRSEIIQYMDCDLVSINETHLLNKDNIHLTGYRWIGLNRSKLHVNAPKGSGGVGILIKERLYPEYKIDIIDNLVDGILGIKLPIKLTKLTFVVLSFSKQCDTASASGLKFSHDDHN